MNQATRSREGARAGGAVTGRPSGINFHGIQRAQAAGLMLVGVEGTGRGRGLADVKRKGGATSSEGRERFMESDGSRERKKRTKVPMNTGLASGFQCNSDLK